MNLCNHSQLMFKKHIQIDLFNMVAEFIYLDEEGEILYTSRNNPLKYEDQTDCVKIEVETDRDMDRVLDLMGLEKQTK